MSERKTATGVLESIEEKPTGWYEIHVNIGSQYPLRLATKKQDLVEKARAAGTEKMEWTYSEQESDRINEHTGKPYVNRYFDGVGAAVSGAAKGDVDWDSKERRDYRSRAWAQTISAFTHTIPSDADVLETFNRLKGFQRLVYYDIVRELGSEEQVDEVPFEEVLKDVDG